jgi:hypothetical protein
MQIHSVYFCRFNPVNEKHLADFRDAMHDLTYSATLQNCLDVYLQKSFTSLKTLWTSQNTACLQRPFATQLPPLCAVFIHSHCYTSVVVLPTKSQMNTDDTQLCTNIHHTSCPVLVFPTDHETWLIYVTYRFFTTITLLFYFHCYFILVFTPYWTIWLLKLSLAYFGKPFSFYYDWLFLMW